MYWHPAHIGLIEPLKVARTDREVRLTTGALAAHVLTIHYAAHNLDVPSNRKLAEMCGIGKDLAGDIRDRSLAFHAEWSTRKDRTGDEPPPDGRRPSPDEILARLEAAERRAAAAEARAAAAEQRAALLEAAHTAAATSPPVHRQPAATSPPDDRHSAANPPPHGRQGFSDGNGVSDEVAASPPPLHRQSAANPPPERRQSAAETSSANSRARNYKTLHTNPTSQEEGEDARPRDPHPPPPPPGTEEQELDGRVPPAGSAAAVLAGWEAAWRRVCRTKPPRPQPRGDASAAATLLDAHPGLDVAGYTALAERYLRDWAGGKRWPKDPTPTTWSLWRPPTLVLAPALPPDGWDDDPLSAPATLSQPERPAWVSAAEQEWWELAGKGRRFLLAPSEALVAWWAEHDPEALHAAEGVMGYPLQGGEEVVGGW